MAAPNVTQKWEEMQVKTFTKWCNMHLAKRGKKIDSCLTGFTDGVQLIQLLEVIGEANLGRHNANPKMRLQKVENVGRALAFIKERGVQLASIGAEDIVDANVKLTLGMIWTVILRFAISELSEEGLSAKQGLLLWCQKKTAGYKDVDIKEFDSSWKDGLGFAAIIHRHRPDLIDFASLSKENPRDNLNLSFEVLETLGVPKLLDTEDMISLPKPDEKSVMAYCAELYRLFSSYDKVEIAGKRVAKFIAIMKAAQEMIHDYEERARALRGKLEGKTVELDGAAGSLAADYAGVKAQIGEFREYKKGQRVQWLADQADLAVLLSNINLKMRSMNRPAYVPPTGLSTAELEDAMEQLTASERRYRSALNAQMRSVLDGLRKAFAGPANSTFDALTKFKSILTTETDVAVLELQLSELQAMQPQLEVVAEAERACEAANIEENEYSDHSYDDLRAFFDQLAKTFAKKTAFLKAQAEEAAGGESSTAAKMQEFKESFDHFDADKNGYLSVLEFQSCLASLGLVSVDFTGKDKTAEKIFNEVTGGAPNMLFEQYAAYMGSLVQDTFDPKQLQESFKQIANGKEFVTDSDLARAQIPADQAAFVASSLPASNGGYDYNTWCQ